MCLASGIPPLKVSWVIPSLEQGAQGLYISVATSACPGLTRRPIRSAAFSAPLPVFLELIKGIEYDGVGILEYPSDLVP